MKTFFYPNLLSGISLILNYSTKSYYSWKKNVYLLGDGRLHICLFYLFTLKNISNNLMIYIIYDYLMNVEVIYDKKPLQRNKVYCMSRKNRSCMYIITTWFSFLLGYKKCWNGTFEKGVLGQMYLTWKVGIG